MGSCLKDQTFLKLDDDARFSVIKVFKIGKVLPFYLNSLGESAI